MVDRMVVFRWVAGCALGAALAPLAWAQPDEMTLALPPAGAPTTSEVSPLVKLPPITPAVARPSPNPSAYNLAAAELRWRSSFDAFAEQDRRGRPQPGGVLFVGSSSIRLWDNLETAFQQQPVVIKRGFGGSRLADCVAFIDRLVLPYQARQVVLYAGENDLDEGASPAEVLLRYERFVQHVLKAAPGTRIAFVSIKPSPARESLQPAIQLTNRLVKAYSDGHPQLDFIDVYSAMLDDNGRPKGELFSADRLHLNATGYAVWRELIAARLKL